VKKFTSEKESSSFRNSAVSSSFSMASKRRTSSSYSWKAKYKGIRVSAEASGSGGNEEIEEKNATVGYDEQFQQELKTKSQIAIVDEYSVMPMKSFDLAVGGLVFADYAFYRIREYHVQIIAHCIHYDCNYRYLFSLW